MAAEQKDENHIKTGSTESAIKGDKQRKLKIYGSIAAAFIFGAIGVYALLASHAAPINYTQVGLGQVLGPGQQLGSSTTNPAYRLVMQGDGNLVVYNRAGHATWNTHTAHTGSHNFLAMQNDGNLVVYTSSGHAVWNSHTAHTANVKRLLMQSDGNLVIYRSDGTPVWSIHTGKIPYYSTSLTAAPGHGTLNTGQSLGSSKINPTYKLVMQSDGNLVVYNRAHKAVWNSHTAHTGSHNRLSVSSGGYAAVYTSSNKVVWESGGAVPPNSQIVVSRALVMQKDGNLGLYTSTSQAGVSCPIWSSLPVTHYRTSMGSLGSTLYTGQQLGSSECYPIARLVMQGDGNLVVYKDGRAVWDTHTNHTGSNNFLSITAGGDLVVYNYPYHMVWDSGTGVSSISNVIVTRKLVLETNGNLVLYPSSNSPSPIWTAFTGKI